jgi:hypothetical protein
LSRNNAKAAAARAAMIRTGEKRFMKYSVYVARSAGKMEVCNSRSTI